MSSFAASAQGQIKEVLRTALIGVQPGDQVMLKGYLRVLLRLEVDLEWVPANGTNVDLFLINSQFRSADSVIKLLEANASKPVLYVSRGSDTQSGLNANTNTITLPLKKLHDLNSWLFDNVAVLHDNKSEHRQRIDDSELILNGKAPVENTRPVYKVENTVNLQTTKASTKVEQTNEQASLLLNFAKKLILREDKYYELWAKDGFVGIIHSKPQTIWLSNNSANKQFTPDSAWELRETQRRPSEKNKGQDLLQWLWLQAFHNPKALLPLLSSTQKFELCFWVKPPKDGSRRAVLRLLTALEAKPQTMSQLAETAETSMEMVSKTLVGLLFSGNLKSNTYKLLKADIENYNKITSLSANPIKIATSEQSEQNAAVTKTSNVNSVDDIIARRKAGEVATPVSSSYDVSKAASLEPESKVVDKTSDKPATKKRGFLSKLRAKLGL